MNKTQLQTTLAPIVAALAGFLAGKGVFGLDTTTWITILGGIVAFGATIWGAISTRASALKDTTGGLPNTTVITDKASADALPNNPDVVAATPEIINAIQKAN